MVIWVPLQYETLHDHPNGGCMATITKEPGLKKILYEKYSSSKETIPQEYCCCQQRNINDSRFAIPNFGCDINKFTTLALREVERYTARFDNEYSVKKLKVSKTMHIVWNPYNDTSLALSYYLDYHIDITFWLPDDYIHAPECLSRGDDKRSPKLFGASGIPIDEQSGGLDFYNP